MDMIWDDNHVFIAYKKKGVGKGRAKSGQRKKWRKKYYFEQDLFTKFQRELDEKGFKARFAGYTAQQLDWFFNKIKKQAIRPKETEWHCRNKLLMWLDKLHNCLSYEEIKNKYQIGIATAKSHINDILKAILESFKDSQVITFPTETQRIQMVNLLKKKNDYMPHAILSMDGSHTRCTGRHITERLSQKYHWLPCFNVLFIIERVFGTICAFNLDDSARKHDLTALRESWFYSYLDEVLDGWVILADKGYIGAYNDKVKCIAAVLRKGMDARDFFPA